MLGAARPEDPLDALNQLVDPNLGAIVVVLAVACIVLLVAVVAARPADVARSTGGLRGLTRGAEGQSLESILDAHLDKVYAVGAPGGRSWRPARRSSRRVQRKAVQRVGLVRFNPFEDTGGNQSFALALLDAHGDGFIVSSLHARTVTRVYGKAVAGGKSEAALSGEEAEALRQALASGPGPARAG